MPQMDEFQLTEKLTRIETLLENLNSTYQTHLTDHADHEARIRTLEKDENHENRLRALEKKVWSIPSATILLAALGTLAAFLGLK